jgi:hypothetical protein
MKTRENEVSAIPDEDIVTLEPDGQATGCNPVEVGSIPTGVFQPISGPELVHKPATRSLSTGPRHIRCRRR